MPVEGRALASGVLLKETRRGDWPWACKHQRKFGLSRESFTSRRSLNSAQVVVARHPKLSLAFVVYLEVKPVGKPDAVVPHVRFDERGWETELYATAPVLDSTVQPVLC